MLRVGAVRRLNLPVLWVPVRWRHVRAGRSSDHKSSDKVRNQLAKALGGLAVPHGKKHRAVGMFELLKDATNSATPDLSKCFHFCGQSRDVQTLGLVWRMAKSRQLALNRQLYGEFIAAAARTAQSDKNNFKDKTLCLSLGKGAWTDMARIGLPPRLPEYGAALALCAKTGDAEWASELWSEISNSSMKPDSMALSEYLEAMAQDDGWDIVEEELARMKTLGVEPRPSAFAALLSTAGAQHQRDRIEWVWDSFPDIQSTAAAYVDKARALLLCGEPAVVPTLRVEMTEKDISPIFRTFLCEAQALLLMLQEEPISEKLAHDITHVAGLAQTYSGSEVVAREERHLLEELEGMAQRLVNGEELSYSDVHILI
uniref:Pentacotripeptide-repeat region of PRORP domain-containing protein n=1 Tax=Noctiluca scintillans TaxID=2966 RepID=A0A7S1F1I6_NOCSC|mmetsp:Transcript_26135/g.68752  ORF Transcript_26135/g.68752 Transcript_26135/m.68752 type:complete len:371 (+) Transcript_26135:57-1169(+)|eukprot:CAMPEP_0194478938 /NCGR_PEP_ID=MMETSP0253-20130528/2219_1 /TAXON_ID=2966 /ORGANISM="Noctiluca scintillans" /LENGTH=370 /DNA_ID=CAMNT_0039318099 /DNA_START=51 /DNA_END=1163 /DNA_ORIENTATION=-